PWAPPSFGGPRTIAGTRAPGRRPNVRCEPSSRPPRRGFRFAREAETSVLGFSLRARTRTLRFGFSASFTNPKAPLRGISLRLRAIEPPIRGVRPRSRARKLRFGALRFVHEPPSLRFEPLGLVHEPKSSAFRHPAS